MSNNKKISSLAQMSSTLITFFFAFLLPLITYTQLYLLFSGIEEMAYLRSFVFVNLTLSIVIGVLLTILRYAVYYFDKHTLKRSLINFVSAAIVMVLLVSSAQIGVVRISFEGLSMFLDFSGIFILLVASWALVVFKTVYDLAEIKFSNEVTKDAKDVTKYRKMEKIRGRGLVKCPKCKYTCRREWKKCPICKSKLIR